MSSNSPLQTHRLREFLEQARARRIVQQAKVFRNREQLFLELLTKLIGFFLATHAVLYLLTLGVAAAVFPLIICVPVLVFAYVSLRAHRFQASLESLLLTTYLAYISHNAFGGTFANLDELGYLLVPLVLGVLLLSARSLVALAIADLVVVAAVGLLTVTGGPVIFVPMLMGIAFASALALTVKHYLTQVHLDQKAESAENESIFRGLITNLPIFLVVLDREGIITLVEGRALEGIPFKPENFIGRAIEDAYRDVPQIVEDSKRALNGEEVYSSAEFGGMVLDVWYSPLRIGDGELSGVIAVATDVTERQRAEEVLQEQASLLQSVSDAIISFDLDFRIQTWNRAAEIMYGWLSFEVIDKPISDVIQCDMETDWFEDAKAHVLSEGVWDAELIQRRRDGTAITIQSSFSLLGNELGEFTGIIMVARDVTERKNSERKSLELSLEREKVKLLREFIGDSSHDFRTPLTTIRTSAYLLRMKNPEIPPKHLDVIDEEVEHLTRLVNDLLTLARLDSSANFEMEAINLDQMIREVLGPLQLLARGKNQHLDYRNDSECVMNVRGDREELERVMVNLMTNAITYTLSEGVIHVEARCEDNVAIIRVQDNGVGISANDLPHVFERFFRVDKTRGSKTGGAGLGLPIARKIVEAHGGSISVESAPNVGSTFIVRLPLIP